MTKLSSPVAELHGERVVQGKKRDLSNIRRRSAASPEASVVQAFTLNVKDDLAQAQKLKSRR